MAEESLFHEVVGLIPQRNCEDGALFPIVLSPNPKFSESVQLTEAIKANRAWLDSLLYRSGAILFRGFNVSSASDFNDVVESSGYEDFSYGVGGAGSRTKVFGRVYTANEAPPDQSIPFHHELSHAPVFPSKLFFFCEIEPGSGGETCIALSHVIYERMKQKHPKFVEEMENKGLIYIRVLGEESDPSSPVGRSWKETFMTDDKSVAEERAAKLGMKLEWIEGAVRVIIGPKPGFRYDDEALNSPSKLFFFCEEAPGSGGQTPIALSHIIYEKMKAKHPEFVSKLEEHGLKYIRFLDDQNQQSSFNGNSWKSSYMTDDKKVAEERAEKLGSKLEWMANNALKVITGPIPAIRFDQESQRKTWFNNLTGPMNGKDRIFDENVCIELGNGEVVPDDAMEDCSRILEEECVIIPWKKGDVMLINNLMVLHGREPLLKPPRRILASLCK